MARTGAKRRSEPGRARFLFGCVPIICGEWMGHDCCRPPQLRFVGLQYLFSLIPKVTLLTQLHLGLLHFRPALRGFEFRSLRSPTSELSDPDDLLEVSICKSDNKCNMAEFHYCNSSKNRFIHFFPTLDKKLALWRGIGRLAA